MIKFYKYQGAGNDFVIIDNRDQSFDGSNTAKIAKICDRRFGVGADGLMLLEDHTEHDFTMRYFNNDGQEASMCGNGGRCISAFAVHQNIVKQADNFSFMAVDGVHYAAYNKGIVTLKMIDVDTINQGDNFTFLDTGSPHHVIFVKNVDAVDVYNEGKAIRYSDHYPNGTNVNFVQFIDNKSIKVRTYERGVEDETLACGTGVVASAISAHLLKPEITDFDIDVPGGKLRVYFTTTNRLFKDIWLEGPAKFVFDGHIDLPSN